MKIIISILLLFSFFSLSAQIKKDSTFKVIKYIKIKSCPICDYDICFENRQYKFEFNKEQLLIYLHSRRYQNDLEVQNIIEYMDTVIGPITFTDPYWEMNHNPEKYGIKIDTTFLDDDPEQAPVEIIERNLNLKYSDIFERIIREYLMTGEFILFNKQLNTYLKIDRILLAEIYLLSGNEYRWGQSWDNAYCLLDGTYLLSRKCKVAMADDFNKILNDSKKSRENN